ncbi:abscisic acid responsive elements-binding factor 2 [Rhynchospora pubera]|uniref:Abscisic acid responsive elements-binding factor 2 n=1 Tax=Rhynchospora pubera TaxID=906938 RepID=A0AAV8C248_9POAL|nr:abscisic acid responsive elements-binding factor 2 [Rhynchospora pubera]
MDFTNKVPPDTPLPLARQGSVYSLTFDEFQSTLGGGSKDFGSMNMDELLKSIWNAEETQATMASASGCGPTGTDQQTSGIHRQGSLTLPRTLSQKTVDQVWKDIIGVGTNTGNAGPSSMCPAVPVGIVTKEEIMQKREPTLGEMTLEEFLVRAGVVREEPVPQITPFGVTTPTVCESNFGNLVGSPMQPRPFGGLNNGSVVPGFVGLGPTPVSAPVESPVDLNGNSSDLSPVPVPYVFKGFRGRKGAATVEKVAERRQRRMIKNRESAARSRARKQAYMMELEAEIAKLKEQNKELQEKQVEMMKIEKAKVQEVMSQQPMSKRVCLRRTFTGPCLSKQIR